MGRRFGVIPFKFSGFLNRLFERAGEQGLLRLNNVPGKGADGLSQPGGDPQDPVSPGQCEGGTGANGSGDDKQGHPEAAPSGLRLSALILPGQRYPALPACGRQLRTARLASLKPL